MAAEPDINYQLSAATPSRPTALRSAGQLAPGARIVLLSGDPESGQVLVEMLAGKEFSVSLADPFARGREEMGDAEADLLLLDAGHDSAQLFSWMKTFSRQQAARAPFSAVLVLTPAECVPQAMETLQLGAYDYVVRPFSAEQLLAAVRRAVEYRRLRVQNDMYRHHLDQLIAARTKILQQAMHQLEQSYDITLEALGNALDLKDAETEGHSKRVTAYTLALGRAMGLNEPELRVIGRGAFLHDIGKMAIPDAILRKPGKLTEDERIIMRTHSELGYRMIRKIPYLREAAEIVYAHQECYEGSGYPRGLRGEEIHIGARIFAVADTLDAITSNRPYRKASTIREARQEVLRCAGTQFDPAIVDVFLATPDSIWLNLREGIMRDGPEFSPFGYTFGEVC